MEQPISIWMSISDANMVQKVFDRKENPGFTIMNKVTIPDGTMVQLEIYFESSIHLWHLAKEVEMHQSHDARVKSIIEETAKKLHQ